MGSARSVRLTLHRRDGTYPISWTDVGELDWSNFALVLGAGGATGLSFEAGCLLALATDHRIRVGDAAALVGTSAGSIAGSLIALGFDALDLAAVVADVHRHIDPSLASMGVRFEGDLPTLPGLVHLLRRPTIGSTVAGVGQVFRRRFTAALTTAVREGQFDLLPHLKFLDVVEWPEPDHRLRVCATRADSGQRSVFSRRSGVRLMEAVAGSCAVPGVMRPVMIDGVPHVDGGLVSPTNADLLDDFEGGLIVVLSPMSGGRSASAIGRVSSAHARRRLGSELKSLRKHQPVLVIEPANELSAMVVDSALGTEHSAHILTASYLGSSRPA
jgi:NTE family protein